MAINVKNKLVTLESLGVAYSAEQDAREEADQALSTRIDNIVAPDGDPSLTEVSDARVSGSTTYNTLKARLDADKAAIGTEISQLSADLGAVGTKKQASDYLWYIGYIKPDGTNGTSTVMARLHDFVHVSAGDMITFDISTYLYQIFFYSSNVASSFTGNTEFADSVSNYTVESDCYIRLNVKNNSSHTMTAEDRDRIASTIYFIPAGSLFHDVINVNARLSDNEVVTQKNAQMLSDTPVTRDITGIVWSVGSVNYATGAYATNTATLRTRINVPQYVKTISISLNTGWYCAIAWYNGEMSTSGFVIVSGNKSAPIASFDVQGDIAVILMRNTEGSDVSTSDGANLTGITYAYPLSTVYQDADKGIVQLDYTEGDGYYASGGNIDVQNGTYLEKYIPPIRSNGLKKVRFQNERTTGDCHVIFCKWDSGFGNFQRTAVKRGSLKDDLWFNVPDDGYWALSYRSYGSTATITAYADTSDIVNSVHDIYKNIGVTYDFDHLLPGKISINHRGYHVDAPENTLPAFRLSKQMGFNFIETDIGWTKDNVPVCMHDGTLNRTFCNADGTALTETVYFGQLTYEELLAYDACTTAQWPVYHGTKIPTFAEVLDLCQAIGIYAVIELKGLPSQERVNTLVQMAHARGMQKSIIWLSGDRSDLIKIIMSDKGAYVALYESALSDANAGLLARLKTGRNRVMFDVESAGATVACADICEKYGLDVGTYSLNNESLILGLDSRYRYITSDRMMANKLYYDANIGDSSGLVN